MRYQYHGRAGASGEPSRRPPRAGLLRRFRDHLRALRFAGARYTLATRRGSGPRGVGTRAGDGGLSEAA